MKFWQFIKGLFKTVIISSVILLALYFVVDTIIEANERYVTTEKLRNIRAYLDQHQHAFLNEALAWADNETLSAYLLTQKRRDRNKILNKSQFASKSFDFVVLFNSIKAVRLAKSFDAEKKRFLKLDEKILYQLNKKGVQQAFSAEESRAGYIYSNELYLIVILPVSGEGEEAALAGYLVLGQKVSDKKIRTDNLVDILIEHINLAQKPEQERLLKKFESSVLQHIKNRHELKSSLLLNDISGQPLAVFSLTRPQQSLLKLLEVSWSGLMVLLIVSLLVGYLFWRNKRGSLHKDISRLVEDIQNVRVGTELSGRISNDNRHIFSPVVTAINQKIGGFEQSIDTIHTEGRRQDAEIVLNELPLEAYLKDTELRYITVNQKYCDSLGMVSEEIIGRTDEELAEIAEISVIRDQELQVISLKEPLVFEEVLANSTRGVVFYSTHLVPFISEKGRVEGVVGVKIDITDHRRAEEEMEMASKVLENTAEGVMVTDAECRIIHVNSAYTEITGYAEAELLGKVPLLLQKESKSKIYQGIQKSLEENGVWSGELWSSRKDGSSYPEMVHIKTIRNRDGAITNYFSMTNDITDQKKWEEQLYQMAHYDSLTGLPNRTLFKDRLRQEIIRGERNEKNFGVLFLDLDLFKSINDSLGHAAGDELLKIVGDRLRSTLRTSDSIARLGGDEFTIMVTDLASDYEKNISYLTRLCEKIIDVIKQPMQIGGREISATCSVGVTVYPRDADNVEDLLRNADSAMYYAKSQGRRNYQFYSKEFNEHAVERLEKEIEFRAALKSNALEVYYQPQIDVISRHVVGAEALLRWKKDGAVILGPDKIVALAEETGLIYELGTWIMKKACSDCKKWKDLGHKNLRVAVNLSTRQFRQKDLVSIVGSILEETGLPGKLLELEVTESALMENIEYSVGMMRDLSKKGIRWSLDDFGTGYSSLTYLRDFPVHVLKVDQSFVREITINPEDSAIVETIIDLAHRLHLTVIAEGVENAEQLKVLSRMNCEQVQGYFFSQPMNNEKFLEYVSQGVRV